MLGQLKFDVEELEVKNETLTHINISLEDKLEQQNRENSNLVNKIAD